MPLKSAFLFFITFAFVLCLSAKSQGTKNEIAISMLLPKINYKENKDTTVVVYYSLSALENNMPSEIYIGDEKSNAEKYTGYYDPYLSPKKVQEEILNSTKEELMKLGYIDTSKKILNKKVQQLYLEISVENFCFYLVKKGLMFRPGYQMDLTYVIKDHYYQKQLEMPLHIVTNYAMSNSLSIKETKNLSNTVLDTLKKTLKYNIFDVLQSPDFAKALKKTDNDTEEQILNETAPFITLNAQHYESMSAGEVIKAVVTIITNSGHGSGCIISQDGYIVTNYHVIAGATKLTVTNDELKTDSVQILRTDKVNDLALLKIPLNNLKHLIFSGEPAETGTEVYTIGTPADIDLGQTISKGIISATRIIDDKKTLQSDARISPGNSGGAMINKKGKLLGIVNAKIVGVGIEGIGFAIPAEIVLKSFHLTY